VERQLDRKVALVTGGGRGIGRAIAETYAEQGARVAITARSENELAQVIEKIGAAGGEAIAVTADLSKPDGPAQVVEQVDRRLGPIEILVNNAGVGSSSNPKPIEDFDDEHWHLTMALNLTAPYLLCKQVLPAMLSAGTGRIVNISSINGKIAAMHGAAYAASKHGLLGLTRTIALETVDRGVTANAICPGPVRTQMNDRRVEYDAQRLGVTLDEQETAMTPMGRRLVPEEIAPMALYLASDISACVTGQAFNIDGGILMAT